MVIRCNTSVWGQDTAGGQFEQCFCECLHGMGWRQAEGVPYLWRFVVNAEHDASLITIVDDYLMSETEGHHSTIDATNTAIAKALGPVRSEYDPDSFAGFSLARCPDTHAITISMPQKIEEATRTHFPDLITSPTRAPKNPCSEPAIKSLKAVSDQMQLAALPPGTVNAHKPELTPDQKFVQRACGSAAFPLRVMPAISLPLHRVSCVAARAPPEASLVLKEIYKYMWTHKEDGITYGGGGLANRTPLEATINGAFNLDDGAPSNLEATADATYDLFELVGILVTLANASVHHSTHKAGPLITSSMQAEMIASNRCSDIVLYARQILIAIGTPPSGPTLVGSDSSSHEQVVNRLASANRSKPFLKSYVIQMQRVQAELIAIHKISDANMPSDFLTKWVSGCLHHLPHRGGCLAVPLSVTI